MLKRMLKRMLNMESDNRDIVAAARHYVATLPLRQAEPDPAWLTGVRERRLAQRKADLADAPDGRHGKAFVCSNLLAAFSDGVVEQHKNDVLNTMLLAQLAANRKVKADDNLEVWYRHYRDVLANIGWALTDFTFEKCAFSGANFSMNKVLVELIRTLMSKDDAAIANAAVDAILTLSDSDDRVCLFEQESTSPHFGRFQVASVGTNETGNPTMKIAAFHVSAAETITRVLWFRFSTSSSSMFKAAQSAILDMAVFDEIRGDLLQKLGERAKSYIHELDI